MTKLMRSLFLIGLISCSTLKVTYDYDGQTDFSKFKTYAFSEDALNLPIQQLNRDRVLKAVEKEMAAKGFSKSDTPDVLVDLQVKAKQEVSATATNTGGMYGGRYGYAYGGGTTHIDYNEYTVGSLFVNIVDKSTDKIVWQGVGSQTLDENASASKRDANINEGVRQIFMNYPPKKK